MKKTTFLGLTAAVLFILSGGCIVVAKTKGPFATGACCKQAVAVDGGIYVIDVHTGDVTKIDPKSVAGAGAFTPCEASHAEIVIDDD